MRLQKVTRLPHRFVGVRAHITARLPCKSPSMTTGVIDVDDNHCRNLLSNSNDAASKSRSKRARVTATSTTLTLAQLHSPDIEELKPSRATPWQLHDDDVATYVLDTWRLRSYATTGDGNCGYYGLCQWMNELGCFQPPCGGGVWTVRRLRATLAALIYEFRDMSCDPTSIQPRKKFFALRSQR